MIEIIMEEKEVKMKKKLLSVFLCVCTVFSMTACAKNKDSGDSADGSIKLGTYKGYTVGESAVQVTEEELQKYISTFCEMYSSINDVTEGTTAEGDTVNVTYHRTVNGVEYKDSQTKTNEDGSSAGNTESVELKTGSYLVEGFVEGLIGKNVGETVEMDLQFPADYKDETVAGQPVHYSVVINSISVTTVPEYTDEFVSEHYAFAGLTTTEQFTEFVRREIHYSKINDMIWDDVLDAQTVQSYPADELKDYVDRSLAQTENVVTAYGYTMDAYYQILGQTEDEFKKSLEEECKSIVKEKMFVRAVAEKEGIQYSDDAAADYAVIMGYASVDELSENLEQYGEDIQYAVLSYLVQNFIYENVTVVSDEETTAEEPAETEETTTDGETAAEETTVAE